MGRRSSGGGDLGEAGEEKGGDAKEIRNGKLLSPKGIEGMEVVMEFGGGFVGRLSDELMKIKAHSAAVFNCKGVKGVSMRGAVGAIFGELATSRLAGGEASSVGRASPDIGGRGSSNGYNVKNAKLVIRALVKGGDVGAPVFMLRERTDDGER